MTMTRSYTSVVAEDYLEAENSELIQQEYNPEELYKIQETNDNQETICINLITLLKHQLRGKGYRIYTANMKLKFTQTELSYYPDVMVTYDERDKNIPNFKSYPCLIVEVLSPETEAFDRGEKFASYRTLETLQEYVIINPKQISVECFRRNSEGLWVLYPYYEGEDVYFASLDFRIEIAALYEDLLENLKKQPYFERTTPHLKPSKKPKNPSKSTFRELTPTLKSNQPPANLLVKTHHFKMSRFLSFAIILLSLTGIPLLSYSRYKPLQNQSSSVSSEPNLAVNTPKPTVPKPDVLKVPIPPAQTEEVITSSKEKAEEDQTQLDESNSLIQAEESGKSEARSVINLIMRMQQDIYYDTGYFAATWKDLGFSVQSKNADYEYKIVSPDDQTSIITATAKKPDLKSYTGVVFLEDESVYDQICESSQPSSIPPEIPEFVDQNFQCPDGYSIVSAIE